MLTEFDLHTKMYVSHKISVQSHSNCKYSLTGFLWPTARIWCRQPAWLLLTSICIKDLGLLLSTNFKFNNHIDAMISEANRQLGVIARVFRLKNSQTIISIYIHVYLLFGHWLTIKYSSLSIWSKYIEFNIDFCNSQISDFL